MSLLMEGALSPSNSALVNHTVMAPVGHISWQQ
jgi:hypothetical protein